MKTRPTRWLKAALPIFALASPALAQEPSQPIRLEHLSPEQVTHIEAEIARQTAFIAGLERQRQVHALP